MASYYPMTPVKKRGTASYDTAGVKKVHSPINKSMLDDCDHGSPHGTPGLVEESPARSPGNTEHDLSLPNTPGSPLYARPSAHSQRRRSNTLPFQSSARMFNAVEGEDGEGLLADDYSQCAEHGIFKTAKGTIINAKDDENLEQAQDLPSATVKEVSPETPTTPDQNPDGDLSDLAKNGLPSACIFVANLAASQTDDQLMKSLQAHFRQFGRLHVKIRRDSKGNPYSFCQFETDEAARVAVRHGRNAIIDSTGRRIRCEPAKVNRTLGLSKHDGSVATKSEVEKLIFGFGTYEALEFAEDENSTPVLNLSQGPRCFVRFTLRQDAVDCYQYFRFHAAWGAEWTNNFSTHGTVPASTPVAVDPFSVFVGKLDPEKTTETELRNRFGEHGTVVECNLVNKSDGRAAFAFIKYSTKEEALSAVEKENNAQFMGNVIHVQKRELHRKAGRGATFSPRQNPLQSLNIGERTSYIPSTDTGAQTISLPLHVYNNLMETYRRGQTNHQLRMRDPSVISSVSNATTYDPVNLGLLYAPDPVTPQSSMISGGNFVLHHQFQSGPAGFGSSASGPTQNETSPRSNAGAAPVSQHAERSSNSPAAASDSMPYNFSPGHLFPGYYNMHSGPGSAFFGGFYPSQLTPRFATDDSSTRRESFASNFEVPAQFTTSMGKLPGSVNNLGFTGHR